jgi:hypothetical protein
MIKMNISVSIKRILQLQQDSRIVKNLQHSVPNIHPKPHRRQLHQQFLKLKRKRIEMKFISNSVRKESRRSLGI